MISKNDPIYVAGHTGLVGSAVLRKLKNYGYTRIITASRKELDLTDQKKNILFFEKTKTKIYFYLRS